ncbi:SbcC/MukB-like Walker B domain-containing protein [Thauera sp.]|uniref:SbcC/MukB-like Walker B domain-containing protein n=1 Tax=Thauera sp. TaxID=1905334 RepID=UPI002D0B1F6C|nr:SbcC/MukB-like Walker B domain-containing protein [Thauera sp.]HRP26187.1 SbcC/MukB-like Walker B domain-containing protein [Thauera sp.]
MSRGRYQLQRREDLADARRAGGLDLEVFDEYTGRSRPASTLSGGEGFMASLSLALGLSDVVQAYAGGVQLDTLFIDEGFGSLDPESLDMAMKTLIDLQQRGRTVGVISHVQEMKQQIDAAIEVEQGEWGARANALINARASGPAQGACLQPAAACRASRAWRRASAGSQPGGLHQRSRCRGRRACALQ